MGVMAGFQSAGPPWFDPPGLDQDPLWFEFTQAAVGQVKISHDTCLGTFGSLYGRGIGNQLDRTEDLVAQCSTACTCRKGRHLWQRGGFFNHESLSA